MIEDNKDKENFKRKLIKPRRTSQAPPPITPLKTSYYILANSKSTSKQEEVPVPMTGSAVKKDLLLDAAGLLYLAYTGTLTPFIPSGQTKGDIEFCMMLPVEMQESTVSRWTYREADVEVCKKQYGDVLEKLRQQVVFTAAKEGTNEIKDYKGFIRSLRVSYVSDTEIQIKAGNQRSKTYSHAELGFHREDTKEWLTLIQILKSKDHAYCLGVAHGAKKVRNKSYDANYKILREISKKFVSFLKETYKLQLPDNFQIFELIRSEHDGTYGLKFTISNFGTEDAHYDGYSKDELIAEIEKLSSRKAALKTSGDEDSEKQLFQITDKLGAAITMAMKKKWIERNRAASYLNPPED